MNAGARLDRLPISSFHRRIMWLIGIGMFFDGFDIYVAATVLGATLHSGFSTMHQNAEFISVTFVGMMLGAFLTGFLGDRYGRRFTYQANLAIFGIASIAAAFAPSMRVLILLRFVMGVGLGAENVVGYATMTEFVPPQTRGKWLGWISVFVVSGSPVTALLGTLIIPRFGWRAMFALGGLGAMVVWYLRKALPESPRWLESVGRTEEADAILSRCGTGSFPRSRSASATRPLATIRPYPRPRLATWSRAVAANDSGCYYAHRRQHIGLWICHLVANLLCSRGIQHCIVAWIFLGHFLGCATGFGTRRAYC